MKQLLIMFVISLFFLNFDSLYGGEKATEIQLKSKREKKKFYPREYFSIDNKKMVLVPAQVFIMGNDKGSEIEGPAHKVKLDAFYMDIYEVTNGEYRTFLKKTGYSTISSLIHLIDDRFNDARQPVVDVAYEDAKAYAAWAGKRLPTEQEWECAAKAGKNYIYPTGKEIDKKSAIYGKSISSGKLKKVGSFKPNPYGIYDLAGNVAEWVFALLAPYPGNDKYNPAYGNMRLTRGGSWISPVEDLKTYRRTFLSLSRPLGNNGFRCVISANRIKK